MQIAIVPWSNHFEKNKMFDIEDPNYNRDNHLYRFYYLREKLKDDNIFLNTIDMIDDLTKIDIVFFFDLNYNYLYKCIKNGLENKMIYFAVEPPVVKKYHSEKGLKQLARIFKYILTWQDDLIDNKKFIKKNFIQYFDSSKNKVKSKPFEKRKLLTNISGNKSSTHEKELYSERLKVIEFFENEKSDDFDFYGIGWDDKKYRNYKGKIKSKYDTYLDYKFALCFENMRDINGYITEKIFDCFKARIVPVYWGASNISRYIPSDCFIDYREFNNISDLYNFLQNMNESQYNSYVKSIEEYLESEQIKDFTIQFFYELVCELINLINIDQGHTISLKDKAKITSKYTLIKIKSLVKSFL